MLGQVIVWLLCGWLIANFDHFNFHIYGHINTITFPRETWSDSVEGNQGLHGAVQRALLQLRERRSGRLGGMCVCGYHLCACVDTYARVLICACMQW